MSPLPRFSPPDCPNRRIPMLPAIPAIWAKRRRLPCDFSPPRLGAEPIPCAFGRQPSPSGLFGPPEPIGPGPRGQRWFSPVSVSRLWEKEVDVAPAAGIRQNYSRLGTCGQAVAAMNGSTLAAVPNTRCCGRLQAGTGIRRGPSSLRDLVVCTSGP